MNHDPHRVSQHAVLTSLVTTLREQIVPAIDDPWARGAAIQLAALAQVLRDRPADPAVDRTHELAGLLTELGHAPGDLAAGSYDSVLAVCSAALTSWDEDDERRHRLRATLVRHLDEDLAANMPLLAASRGQLPDA